MGWQRRIAALGGLAVDAVGAAMARAARVCTPGRERESEKQAGMPGEAAPRAFTWGRGQRGLRVLLKKRVLTSFFVGIAVLTEFTVYVG